MSDELTNQDEFEVDEVEDIETEEVEPEVEPEDDSEEVEYDGQKYIVPKALKSAIMMQSDYTRKTQSVAEERRALEADRQAFESKTTSQKEYVKDVARVVALESQIQEFDGIDWTRVSQDDPAKANQLWIMYSQLKDARDVASKTVAEKEQHETLNSQQISAKRVQDNHAILQRDVPNWSPELASKLSVFAIEHLGFTQSELDNVSDAKTVKLIHKAYLGDKMINKQVGDAVRRDPAPKPKPVRTVGSHSPAAKDMGRMTTAEWMAARNTQISKR